MAAVKLIKFVAVAIMASSSAAEPTNRTCADQDQDHMVALQVGEQNPAGVIHCGDVCPGYNCPACPNNATHFSCSDAKHSYLASNPPGLDEEAFSRSECLWWTLNETCWTHTGSAVTVFFELDGCTDCDCPAGFKSHVWGPYLNETKCSMRYVTSMNAVCPNGWCECSWLGWGCKARGSCR
ncbi:unnamed protein product [Polarella glacialis]|uniref:Uncharacterized protein n=1 Tax=Polarella glacialis TaxID=89957 RepID=A0A813J544_POLGL|nr:unnamed protein product [Polarella glacialis]CAE8623300.1 unnamed protein product [Polarella glacialis]CAE8662875.1 unnamed protein product [Polarella glacialis]